MEVIDALIAQKYALFNVGEDKAPIDGKQNYMLSNWQKMGLKELKTHHNYSIPRWGMRQGLHENGRKTMSLDFDICGEVDPQTGQRVKCSTTEEWLQKYMNGTDKNDGMFNSSTCGNANVIIDYTDNEEICELVSSVKNKVVLNKNLEILTGGNQVIPPTRTKCKIHNKLCISRCFKNSVPILCLPSHSSFQSEFIKELFVAVEKQNPTKTTKIKKVIKNTMVTEATEATETKQQQKRPVDFITSYIEPKWKDFIENVWYHDPQEIRYPAWLKTLTVMTTNGLTDKEIAMWDQTLPDKTPTVKDALKSIKLTEPMPFPTLANEAKKIPSRQEAYYAWVERHAKFITLEQLERGYDTSQIISKTLKHTLIYCNENWFSLNEQTQLWNNIKIPTQDILTEIRSYIDYSNSKIVRKIEETNGEEKEKNIAISKKYLSYYKTIESPSYLSVLKQCLTKDLLDNEFEKKLDLNPGKLAFIDGIMDLETKKWRAGIRWNDFLTKTIPYRYQEADPAKTEFLRGKLKEILNNDEEHLNYFLTVIGHTFLGMPHKEKSIYFCVDKTKLSKGDNGKSFFFEILTILMPNYVYKSKGTLLEEGNAKIHKQLVKTKGMRLVWVDEYGKKKSNAELMKEIGDGKATENEIMHGTSETINILFKLFALTNHMPNIDPNDEAVYNRYKQISYSSNFDRTGEIKVADPSQLQFIADTGLGDKIEREYYNEVFGLIIDYAHNYLKNKMPPIPSQFLRDIKDTKQNNDAFGTWFSEHCIKSGVGKIPLKNLMRLSDMTDKQVKDGMKRQGYVYNSDLSGMGKDPYTNKAYKGGYEGVDLKPEEEAVDETDGDETD
jgi:phage/plasmid-associated DNA primase